MTKAANASKDNLDHQLNSMKVGRNVVSNERLISSVRRDVVPAKQKAPELLKGMRGSPSKMEVQMFTF